ncbi:MAG: MBL fold metallo-hydrolase [candidate division NC10 bacterium]|nr:MBL fold metallo-hydrolase [candidate division NC10 bacterium]
MKRAKGEKRITCLHLPTPFPVGSVNVYFLNGPEPTLIDAGPHTEEAWEALCEGLARAGSAPERIRRIILTHGHVDHYGLACRIARASGAEILAHKGDAAVIREHPEALYRWTAFLGRFLPQAGFSPEWAKGISDQIARCHAGYAGAVPVARVLQDGEELSVGSFVLQVVHTPGHTPGSLGLLDPQTGFLLSGDTLLKTITPNPVLQVFDDFFGERFENLVHYLTSLKKLENLPVRRVLPGHRAEIWGIKTRLKTVREQIEARKAKLLAIVRGREQTLHETTERLFSGLDNRQLLLAFFDCLGHLDLLRREGLIEYDQRAGLIVVRAVGR